MKKLEKIKEQIHKELIVKNNSKSTGVTPLLDNIELYLECINLEYGSNYTLGSIINSNNINSFLILDLIASINKKPYTIEVEYNGKTFNGNKVVNVFISLLKEITKQVPIETLVQDYPSQFNTKEKLHELCPSVFEINMKPFVKKYKIMVHSSTKSKIELIDKIKSKYNLDIKVKKIFK